MGPAKEKVSIIIPTFNRSRYIEQSIESALSQTYEDIEILLTDNASTDRTVDIITRYSSIKRVVVIRHSKNLGMVNNWRKAVFEYATGQWFVILSDDDYLIDNEYITKSCQLISDNKDKNVVMVYSNGTILNENTGEVQYLNIPFDGVISGKEVFLSRALVPPVDYTLCNILFNRKCAIDLDAFSNPFNLSCDAELFLKMCLIGNVGVIPDNVSVYRKHESNLIDSVINDYRYIAHNQDYQISPFNMARETNIFTKAELQAWADRVIIPDLKEALLKLRGFHNAKYQWAFNLLNYKSPELVRQAITSITLEDRVQCLGRMVRTKIKSYFPAIFNKAPKKLPM
jgi:glycosyltransferase involved in cell wall biosynthesis